MDLQRAERPWFANNEFQMKYVRYDSDNADGDVRVQKSGYLQVNKRNLNPPTVPTL
jgi:hypothetical protein